MELSQPWASRLPGDCSCTGRSNCCLFLPPSSPGLSLQEDGCRLQLCMFVVWFPGRFCWFGLVGPVAEVEGSVFCLASNPRFVFPLVLIVYPRKNFGKENKVELQL